MMAELACLALTVYYEARSEPFRGQVAVAQVVMNRVADPRFPKTVCEVVHQGPTSESGMPLRYRCQFSFWCDGLGEEPKDIVAWNRAYTAAVAVYSGVVSLPELKGAVCYHALDASPEWAQNMDRAAVIGNHVFLKDHK